MSKIVVLNSGGFDSIVLMNYLHTIVGEEEIYSLHFRYGALNEKQQLECVNKVCEKVGAINKVIDLPKFSWTKNDFYGCDTYEYQSQYLEYRNLIFLSYAISYAESIGADTVYVAFLNSQGYSDTKINLLDGLNSFTLENSNIFVSSPFITLDKGNLIHFAKYLGVEETDFFTCDVPLNGKPCGKCSDCLYLKELYEQFS